MTLARFRPMGRARGYLPRHVRCVGRLHGRRLSPCRRCKRAFTFLSAELQWVMEGFVVALTVGVLAAGYIAGRVGRRRVFVAGLSVLASGSLLAGLAPSADMLIGPRVAQGVGGAMLLGTGAVTLAEVFGRRTGASASPYGAPSPACAVALSPLVGGLIDTWLGWRWIYPGCSSGDPGAAARDGRHKTGHEHRHGAPATRAPAIRAPAIRAPAQDASDGRARTGEG